MPPKQGSHKKYGPKMNSPRIKASKENRSCGPIGYFFKMRDQGKIFTTRAALFPIKIKGIYYGPDSS